MSSHYEKILATGEVKCIDEEVPFEIPKGWEWVRLEAILNTGSARRVHAKDWRQAGIPFYRAREIGKLADYGFVDNELYIDHSLYEDFSSSGVPLPNDLMITAVGTLGKVYIVKESDRFYYKDGSVLCLANKYGLYAEYLKMVIESPFFKGQYRQESQGTTVATLTMVRLQKYFIPLPPLQEQKRIVEKIAELLPQIERYNKAQEKLDNMNIILKDVLQKSILQEAIQGKLVPQIVGEGTAQELLEQIKAEKRKLVKEGKLKKSALNDSIIFRGDDNKYYEQIGQSIKCIDEEVPFEIPNSWAWSRLSSICSIVNGFTPLRSESKFWDCGTINWFTVDDIKKQGELIYSTKQKITEEATSKERIVRAGSVLLCCTASVGQCALAKIDLTTNQQFNALTVKDINSSILSDNYLFWFAKTLKPTLQRLSGKTTFEFISVKKVGNILIPIPPFKEQERIVAKIEKLFEQLH